MDPADLMELLKLVGAIRSCQGKNTNPLRRMKASGELMDFLEDYPVFAAVPGLSPILKEAERMNQTAMEEVFGRRPAQVAAMPQPIPAVMPQPAASFLFPLATPVLDPERAQGPLIPRRRSDRYKHSQLQISRRLAIRQTITAFRSHIAKVWISHQLLTDTCTSPIPAPLLSGRSPDRRLHDRRRPHRLLRLQRLQ